MHREWAYMLFLDSDLPVVLEGVAFLLSFKPICALSCSLLLDPDEDATEPGGSLEDEGSDGEEPDAEEPDEDGLAPELEEELGVDGSEDTVTHCKLYIIKISLGVSP